MKKIPKDPNWHYLKWLGIAVVSILLFGIIYNADKSLSVLSLILKVFSPIFIGLFIALILNIPVTLFENRVFGRLTRKNCKVWSKIKRAVSIVLSLACFFLICTVLLSYIIPELLRTGQGFVEKAPKYMEDLTVTLREWTVNFNLPIDPESINISWDVIMSWATSFLGEDPNAIIQSTFNTALSIFDSMWNVILGFILAIYIVCSKESLSKLLRGFIYSVASKERADEVVHVTGLSKNAFEGFISGQCIEVLLIGSLTFIGMCIFQFPYPLMVSCIIAVTAFVPIFGAITGAIISAFLILLVDPVKAIWFLIFIIILQQVESNLLYPKIMGKQVGLPSLWVLIAVILGGEFFGIPGIIISVPLCSVFYTLFHEWILKRLREKKLCRANATHIPAYPTPLSDEEYMAPEEDNEEPEKASKVKIKQKSAEKSKKKSKKRSKK